MAHRYHLFADTGRFRLSGHGPRLLHQGCLGYVIADHMRAELVIDAIRMAARNYCLQSAAIFHTDRGSQYLSQAFTEVVNQLDVHHSVGRVGSCFDNAQAESFNATLKVERVNRNTYPTREHARKDVARYIEFRYPILHEQHLFLSLPGSTARARSADKWLKVQMPRRVSFHVPSINSIFRWREASCRRP
jgi:transposase InsO family protein